jgi:hypothetical protein
MNCLNCNKELNQSSTKPVKYCSDACRKAYSRKNAGFNKQDQQCPSVESIKTRESGQEVCPVSSENGQNPDNKESGQITDKPANYGRADCQCKHCQQVQTNKSNAILNHNGYMSASELIANGYTHNRVSLPGDVDYIGVCSQEVA